MTPKDLQIKFHDLAKQALETGRVLEGLLTASQVWEAISDGWILSNMFLRYTDFRLAPREPRRIWLLRTSDNLLHPQFYIYKKEAEQNKGMSTVTEFLEIGRCVSGLTDEEWREIYDAAFLETGGKGYHIRFLKKALELLAAKGVNTIV